MQFAIAVSRRSKPPALSRDGSMLVFVAPEKTPDIAMLYDATSRLGQSHPITPERGRKLIHFGPLKVRRLRFSPMANCRKSPSPEARRSAANVWLHAGEAGDDGM